MDWPLYSSDLNLIEHLWFLLKEKVYEVYPDIEQVSGLKENKQEELWKALFEAWQLIDNEILRMLIKSMPRRIAAVIKSEGWYTKY